MNSIWGSGSDEAMDNNEDPQLLEHPQTLSVESSKVGDEGEDMWVFVPIPPAQTTHPFTSFSNTTSFPTGNQHYEAGWFSGISVRFYRAFDLCSRN